MSGRKIIASLLMLALAVALAPMAASAGIPGSPAAARSPMPISMPCNQAPMKDRQMPCCGCCLGMLGCVAPVAPPLLAALPIEFQYGAMSWGRERDPGDGATHPPFRPPIL